MFTGMIKRKIKKAVYEIVKELTRSFKSAKVDYDSKNKTYVIKFKKEW